MLITPLKTLSKAAVNLAASAFTIGYKYIWKPIDIVATIAFKPLIFALTPVKYALDTMLIVLLPDYVLYRMKQIVKLISGGEDSLSLYDLFSKTNMKTNHAEEAVVLRFFSSLLPESLYDSASSITSSIEPYVPASIKSLQRVVTLGHYNTDGTFNWDVTFAMYEAALFQRAGIILTSKRCFPIEKIMVGGKYVLSSKYVLLGHTITTDKAIVSALYVGSKLTFGLLDFFMFNMYSPQIFFNQASQNIEKDILRIEDKATTIELARLMDIENNRLLNFAIQKGNCLKELLRITLQMVDAAAGQGGITIVANAVSFSILYLVQDKIYSHFDEGKKYALEAAQLHHKLLDGTYNTTSIIAQSAQIRANYSHADLYLKSYFLIVSTIDLVISTLFRDREIFRIHSIILGPSYNEAEEKEKNERTYDEATKGIAFVTSNYLRLTEVLVIANVINMFLLQKIDEISARTPEELAELNKLESQAEESKKLDLIQKQIASLPENIRAALLAELTAKYITLSAEIMSDDASSNSDSYMEDTRTIGADNFCLLVESN